MNALSRVICGALRFGGYRADMTRAYLATTRDRTVSVGFRDVNDEELGIVGTPTDGDVDLDVLYSDINYKDALLLTEQPGIARGELIVPGIDMVGRVSASSSEKWSEGDLALIAGAGLGESRHGGLAERIRVPGELLIRLPVGLEASDAAALGTAGFTAMLAVRALEAHPGALDHEVLVTGASGGAAAIAIMLLAEAQASVVASTGRVDEQGDALRELGADAVIDRAELGDEVGKPMQKERFSGVVDSVGSVTLANAIAQIRREGIVAAFGMAQGRDLPASVLPFILRGVTLRGINSVEQPMRVREEAWSELAERIDLETLRSRTREVPLEDAQDAARALLDGQATGRTIVRIGE